MFSLDLKPIIINFFLSKGHRIMIAKRCHKSTVYTVLYNVHIFVNFNFYGMICIASIFLANPTPKSKRIPPHQ